MNCGKELPEDAIFCIGCGKPQQSDMSTKEEKISGKLPQESKGPAADNLKDAIDFIFEVREYITTVSEFTSQEYTSMEKNLFKAQNLITRAQKSDPDVSVIIPGTNQLIGCNNAFALNSYTIGRLGFEALKNMEGMSKMRAISHAQINFKESNDLFPNPEASFFYARALHEEYNMKKSKMMPQGKLKAKVIEAYEYVIKNWPDSEWADESRKFLAELQ